MKFKLVVVLIFAVVVSFVAASLRGEQESETSQLDSRELLRLLLAAENDEEGGEFDLQMPDVAPKQKDIYVCRGMALDPDRSIFITEIVPHASVEIVHHMGISGCSKPGSNEDFWICNDFDAIPIPICYGPTSFVFAWAKGAQELQFPGGAGLKVGGDTGIHYLVMQVHYNNVDSFINGGVDHSGVHMKYTFQPLPHKVAIILLSTTDGFVEPGQEAHWEVACPIDEDVVLHPFAMRTHSHQLGRVTSAYRVRNNEWTEIGRRSPQLPQAFVPANPVTLTKGDVVAARCTMFNFKNHTVHLGATNEDEMCLFYILYYADGEKPLSWESCNSTGPPLYYWDKDLDVGNVPADASMVPPPPNGPDPEQAEQMHRKRGKQSQQDRRRTLLALFRQLRVLP